MAIIATNAIIDIDVFHHIAASGVGRLRADEEELRSIFPVSSLFTLTEQNNIVTWFKSDKADITYARGFLPLPKYLPSMAFVLSAMGNTEKYIGNAQPHFQDDPYPEYRAWPFNRMVTIQVSHDNPANAFYLFKMLVHIMLSAEDLLTATYHLRNLVYSGGQTEGQPNKEGNAWIYEFLLKISYEFNEEQVETTAGDIITEVVVDQEIEAFELPEPPSTDPSA